MTDRMIWINPEAVTDQAERRALRHRSRILEVCIAINAACIAANVAVLIVLTVVR